MITFRVMRFVVPLCALVLSSTLLAENWPAWRGPTGTGLTTETKLPLTWSATENVKWKVALPEKGNSSPIVWGDRVFLTQNVGQQRAVICFDRKDGKQLWQAGPTYTEKEQTHPANPYCAASAATDGERVIASFGSAGLWCFDFAGKELWHLDLGKQDHQWGYASAPVLDGKLCYLAFGPGPRTFLLAVDKSTGKEVWRHDIPPITPKLPRNDGFGDKADGVIGSWSTPLRVNADSRKQLIMTWPEQIASYDPDTGKELWTCGGLNPLIYASPIYGDDVVIGCGGY